jgi:hypothetical protein
MFYFDTEVEEAMPSISAKPIQPILMFLRLEFAPQG